MSTISRFYGIIIKMYFLSSEHNPPHIHAFYNKNVAVIDIQTLNVIEGYLPTRALKLVREWLLIHKNELHKIWLTQEFKKIEPLN
ncbi:MAG: DUF4160 domain-containing protein [Clostridia bacterium]|nr:DUF4160 domain-containing protein [Clostridia bacterium]